MTSNILPQALLLIPTTNPIKFHSKSVSLSSSSITSNLRRFSISSKVSCNNNEIGSSLFNSVVRKSRPSFGLRAEGGEGEVELSVGGEEDGEGVAVAEVAVEGDAAEGEEETKPKTPRKPRIAMGDIMGILNKRAIEVSEKERPVPDLRTGDIVEIKLEVPENRRRASIYKGIVISKQNAGIHTTIRIRRIIAGIGVEIVFPVSLQRIRNHVLCLVFVGYMVVDTQHIVEEAHHGDTDYVKHALKLFRDFVAVFVRILIIMLRNSEGKRKEERKKKRRD